MAFFSLIVPVYNRPEEMQELLQSLNFQSYKDFEVVVIEDGSQSKSDNIVESFKNDLQIQYLFKENEGPSIARSFGSSKANGEYLIFTDSDCILPPDYLETINRKLNRSSDVFGGPDRSHSAFSILQKAINFSMTSVLTTGGARGSESSIEKFYPRSFNMGIRRSVFEEIGGFPNTKIWPGEDMIMGIELINRGYITQYIHEAFVYHKRRSSLGGFFKQIKNFGKVRIYISLLYPETFKLLHVFPVFFVLFVFCSTFMAFKSILFAVPLISYILLIFLSAAYFNKSLIVGIVSVVTTFYQFFAYAYGLVVTYIRAVIFKNPEYSLNRSVMFSTLESHS